MLFFFFKQKTAYELRISDWSSEVCSSDLKCNMTRLISQTWQCDPALSHIFAGAVRIAGFTWLVALQEEELARAFVGVDLCGQRRGIGKLQRHMTFPARFQRSDVNEIGRASRRERCVRTVRSRWSPV